MKLNIAIVGPQPFKVVPQDPSLTHYTLCEAQSLVSYYEEKSLFCFVLSYSNLLSSPFVVYILLWPSLV